MVTSDFGFRMFILGIVEIFAIIIGLVIMFFCKSHSCTKRRRSEYARLDEEEYITYRPLT